MLVLTASSLVTVIWLSLRFLFWKVQFVKYLCLSVSLSPLVIYLLSITFCKSCDHLFFLGHFPRGRYLSICVWTYAYYLVRSLPPLSQHSLMNGSFVRDSSVQCNWFSGCDRFPCCAQWQRNLLGWCVWELFVTTSAVNSWELQNDWFSFLFDFPLFWPLSLHL